MFALGIRYLTGTAVAAHATDRSTPEWPPDPARVFMALTAAWGEAGEDESEAEALRWLEELGSPSGIAASEAGTRTPSVRWVPVNDELKRSSAPLQSAPALTRARAERSFPTVRPESDRVFLIWAEDLDRQVRPRLEAICARVSRIGHSSSLVQMWVEDEPPQATWERSEGNAEMRTRSIHAGLLEALGENFARTPERLPVISVWTGYRRAGHPGRTVAGTVWQPESPILQLVPLESAFRRLDLVSTLQLTGRLHAALVSLSEEPVPEVLSGHRPDGSPTESPHVAFLPLPFAGHPHADGEIRGIALALPRGMSPADRRSVLRAVARVGEDGRDHRGGLKLGRLGRWKLEPSNAEPAPDTLRSTTWTAGRRGAEIWGSVTPVAFDRHPKSDGAAYLEEVSEMMAAACRFIGLPQPVRIDPLPVSVHPGLPTSREFPRITRKDGSRRRHLHARLVFPRPVRGPVAIGAGRFRGYGFFKPVRKR